MTFAFLPEWYQKAAAFKVESLFSHQRSPMPPRSVFVHESLPEGYFDKKHRPKKDHLYTTNQVITSKYTVITFLPRNLLEQFRRIANIFFAAIAILQFFPKFSTISPGLVLLPIFIVLGVTAIKDGYEDIKRHQADRHVNHSRVYVLRGGDWVNPNLMGNKARTFVRGIIPRSHRKNLQDLDALEHGTLTHNCDLEFDTQSNDGESIIEEQGEDRLSAHWKQTIWEDIRVGDIVKIKDNDSIPADMLICATSEDENVAFVETKNLDGETNLKSRSAVSALTHLRTATDCANKLNNFHVECDRPDTDMYKLNGAVVTDGKKFAIDVQMTLLRGTVLRNTGWVIGVVLFTGQDTKIVLNSSGTPSKRSKVERQINPQVFLNLLIFAVAAIACAIADSILEKRDFPEGAPWLYADDRSDDNPSINGLVTWAFALITFQNIVPISLYLSIEAVKSCQAAFIHFDHEMRFERTNQAALARSWNLSDDLGQIEYIFSDKTGTLTQNSMIFRQCSVGGKVYRGDPELSAHKRSSEDTNRSDYVGLTDNGVQAEAYPLQSSVVKLSTGALMPFRDGTLAKDLADAFSADRKAESTHHARNLNGFFSVLALCHTVLAHADPATGTIKYKAQSPDEAALVQAAADVGFMFLGRDRGTLRLQTPFSEAVEKYELLNILEFTSARKRMSVVLKKLNTEDGRLLLLTKGADNVIFERLNAGSDDLKETTEKHLDEFANNGLRTLTLAYKIIPESEYESWSKRYHEAQTTRTDDRESKIENISDEIEQDLRLLGATAIEDSLQDGVPQTIADLKRAGIKIWVATGDKLETAIAIGHSTNLIGKESNIIVIRGVSRRPVYQQMLTAVEDYFPESRILDNSAVTNTSPSQSSSTGVYPIRRVNTGLSSIVGTNNGDRPGGFVLVVDGAALEQALGSAQNKQILLKLATQCEGVVCCRVSPLQKALVVRLVKEGLGSMTLAIGDGANDVSMIQAADVGVGISGEEGLQAVNSSDYAIAQFRFLKRLLLVHGHWSYARNANMYVLARYFDHPDAYPMPYFARVLNFFYKSIVCIGVLFWFQIYCGWSSNYVFEFTYILFWNSFWTIAPVIGIGVFDRVADDTVLMALPELYRFSREGTYFGMRQFIIYMLDGVYQSVVVYFIIQFAYFSPTARSDGFGVGLFEFSTTMAIATILTTNLYNGMNTNAWTSWVFFAIFLGVVLVWIYTAIYSIISPGWFVTDVYGNNHFLFQSAYFWLSLPITIFLSLLPRYLLKAWKFGYMPNDIDIVRWNRKLHPHHDLKYFSSPLERPTSLQHPMTPAGSRPISMVSRTGSRTDMSTGLRSVHRGFDFATEEGGVVMRRIQSNLSDRRQNSRPLEEEGAKRKGPMQLFSLRSAIRRKPDNPTQSANPTKKTD